MYHVLQKIKGSKHVAAEFISVHIASLCISKDFFLKIIQNKNFTFNEILEQIAIRRSCTTVSVTDITSALKVFYYAQMIFIYSSVN